VNIETKIYRGESISEGANLALQHRLYVPGWDLCGSLKYAKGNKECTIALVFKDGKPVAVSLANRWLTQAFTRKSERRNGYGSLAVKEVRKVNKTSSHGHGKRGTNEFWTKIWN
jgi:hypothetical protein